MARNQVWVSTVGDMKPVFEKAKQVFPDAESEAELARRALMGWYTDRVENGKSKRLEKMEERLSALESKVELLIKLIQDGK